MIFIQGNIFIQGKHIPSGELYPFKEYIHLRNIYSCKFKAICSFKVAIIIQERYFRGHSRDICSKIVPGLFMIIITFIITISWIKYSYSSFRLKDEGIVYMYRGCRIIITIRVDFATIERRNTTRIASNTMSSPKSDMATSKPFISKETVEHTSNYEFLLKIYHLPSFWKLLSSTKLTPTTGANGLTLKYKQTFSSTELFQEIMCWLDLAWRIGCAFSAFPCVVCCLGEISFPYIHN